MCICYQSTSGQRSMINFVIVSSDFRPFVLDTHLLYYLRAPELSGKSRKPILVAWESLTEALVRESLTSKRQLQKAEGFRCMVVTLGCVGVHQWSEKTPS